MISVGINFKCEVCDQINFSIKSIEFLSELRNLNLCCTCGNMNPKELKIEELFYDCEKR